MKLRIYGQNKKVSREELRLATKIMLAHLLSRQMLKNITIYIRQKPNLRLSGLPVYAFVYGRDDRYPPRSFTIWLDSKPGKRMQLRSLAHELTHIKQHATGECRHLKSGLVRWRDKHSKESVSFFAPWEIDATGHENALYEAYKASILTVTPRGTVRRPPPRREP